MPPKKTDPTAAALVTMWEHLDNRMAALEAEINGIKTALGKVMQPGHVITTATGFAVRADEVTDWGKPKGAVDLLTDPQCRFFASISKTQLDKALEGNIVPKKTYAAIKKLMKPTTRIKLTPTRVKTR
jgi:hypothetical protein